MWLSVIAYSQGHLSIYFWVYLAPLIQARQLGLGCWMTSETEHEGWVTKNNHKDVVLLFQIILEFV